MKDRSHDEAMAELFKEDPAFAAEYLNQLLLDGEPADLLVALRQMAQARGGVRAIAKETELNANQLYRTLSPQGQPGSCAACLPCSRRWACAWRCSQSASTMPRHESERTKENARRAGRALQRPSSTPNGSTRLAARDT